MVLKEQLKDGIQQALKEVFSITLPHRELLLHPTSKDFSGSHTLVTFRLVRTLKISPQAIAEQVGAFLAKRNPLVAHYNVVGGFLNLSLKDQVWYEQLNKLPNPSQTWASNGQKILIEMSAPNANKPLHLGHLRNIFLGNAVANILRAVGYQVIKLSHINDRGIHICKSMVAYQQYGQGQTPEGVGMKGDHFVGKYYVKFEKLYKEQQKLVQESPGQVPILVAAQELLKKWEAGDKATLKLWRKMNNWVYQGFSATYRCLGISFDQTYYESDTYLLGKNVVEEGLARDIFYRKKDGSIWVQMADVGLDDKLVLRSDGTAVYITQDLGTADLRYKQHHFDRAIYVVGDEQDYHFDVLFRILRKLKRTYADKLYHLSYGMVNLPGGKMKSREGTVVDADHLLADLEAATQASTETLGKVEDFTPQEFKKLYHTLALGALKYFLLRVAPKKRFLFKPEESIALQGHTGPFIQYTYARIYTLMSKAQHKQGDFAPPVRLERSLHPEEREVIIYLVQWPQVLQEAAHAYSPALIAQYVFDLAKAYNRLYSAWPVLNAQLSSDRQLRLHCAACVARTLKAAMGLLGIDVPQRM